MDKIIHFSAQLNCDQDQVFEMFTTKKHLESWLTMIAEVKPKVGGKYELFWDPNDRENDSTIGCKITAIEPGKFLSFEWKGPKQYKHFMNTVRPLTHVTVFFIPIKNEEHKSPLTELHIIHTGWGNTEEWEEARQWFENAWKKNTNDLKNLINKK